MPHNQTNRRIARRRFLLVSLGMAFAGALTAACGDGADGAGSSSGASATGELEIIAERIAFDKEELSAPAGRPVRLTFLNKDATLHNVAFYRSEDAEDEIFVGEIFGGPDKTIVYEFDAPAEAGAYFFRCDIHPAQMNGTFVVSE